METGLTEDGVYAIGPTNVDPFPAYCDMDGGWTVIQRRVDDSVDFYRGYDDYVAGFGIITGNFWAGLDKIHALTLGATEMYVFMERNDGQTVYAHCTSFNVGDAASGYLLTVSGITGTAGDDLSNNNNMKFSTLDNEQDAYSNGHCAELLQGGWWYKECSLVNPNGPYYHEAGTDPVAYIRWHPFTVNSDTSTHLKSIEIKVRSK